MWSIETDQTMSETEQDVCFTELAELQLKQDSTSALISSGNNMSYFSATGEGIAFQLRHINQSLDNNFPFSISYVDTPLDHPMNEIVKDVDVMGIYEYSNVHDGEWLVLDPTYLEAFSTKIKKADIVHMDWSPIKLRDAMEDRVAPVLTVLNSFGHCALYELTTLSKSWRRISCCINSCLKTVVFPITKKPEEVKNFADLKQLVDVYWLTTFAWDVPAVKPILYVATAAGYIIVFEFSIDYKQVEKCCGLRTKMGSISYIRTNGALLIACSITGLVNVFKVERGTAGLIEDAGILWRDEDRIVIGHAVFIPVTDYKSVLVFFTKGSRLHGFRLSDEGRIEYSSILNIDGIKITGLEPLDDISLIVTTITGTIHHIRFNNCKTGELDLREQSRVKMDWSNDYQILGLATTKHRCLWSFLLFRNHDCSHKGKNNDNTAFIRICKSNRSEPMQALLSTSPEMALDTRVDSLALIGLDILNRHNIEEYNNFCQLETLTKPKECNTEFLHLLQIKWLLLKYTEKFENINFKITKRETAADLEFLARAIKLLYILNTLKVIGGVYKCNDFRKVVVNNMRLQFNKLLMELNKQGNNKPNDSYLNETIHVFKTQITAEYQKLKSHLKPNKYGYKEFCLKCKGFINTNTLMCATGHAVARCAITAIQLPVFRQLICQYCNVAVLDDCEMLELPNYSSKCIYCRFPLLEC